MKIVAQRIKTNAVYSRTLSGTTRSSKTYSQTAAAATKAQTIANTKTNSPHNSEAATTRAACTGSSWSKKK